MFDLKFQKRATFLLVWMFMMGILLGPEAGLVLYMSIHYWVGILIKFWEIKLQFGCWIYHCHQFTAKMYNGKAENHLPSLGEDKTLEERLYKKFCPKEFGRGVSLLRIRSRCFTLTNSVAVFHPLRYSI